MSEFGSWGLLSCGPQASLTFKVRRAFSTPLLRLLQLLLCSWLPTKTIQRHIFYVTLLYHLSVHTSGLCTGSTGCAPIANLFSGFIISIRSSCIHCQAGRMTIEYTVSPVTGSSIHSFFFVHSTTSPFSPHVRQSEEANMIMWYCVRYSTEEGALGQVRNSKHV
jgi:hypothetical protein